MANIGVRSPYFIYYTESGASYATLTLTVGTEDPYIITKSTGEEFLMDIAELVRDFINPDYSGSFINSTADTKSVTYSLQFYDSEDATVGTAKTGSYVAFDAYNYFYEGNTANTGANDSGFVIPTLKVLLSENVVWYPQDTTGTFFVTNATTGLGTPTSFSSSATEHSGITIKRLECSKYDVYKLVFVNKFGVLQEMFFNGKTNTSVGASGEKYKSASVSTNGAIDTNKHQIVDYNKNAKLSYTLNTTFLSEEINSYIQELIASEYVWLQKDSSIYPVNVTSSSVQYKTSLNDKLVSYTLEIEQANDLISTIR